LPLTAALWAGRRDLKTYVAQTNDLARSSYGRRFYRTAGLFEGKELLASCKRYERTTRLGSKSLRAVGFGAVFTPEHQRGKGYATAMLAMLMDEARTAGDDAAFLFSDIYPAFYATLGFKECPSSTFSMRSDSLKAERLRCSPIEDAEWHAIAQQFRTLQSGERWALARSGSTWWDWIRLRLRQRSEQPGAQIVALAARARRRVLAYVLGQRQPKKDVLTVDEFGWSGEEGRAALSALLKNAAGDLRRIAGWLPPAAARAALPRHTTRRRKDAILMIAPLSARGKQLVEIAGGNDARGGVWETDHI
jgi:Acetyltransferase (GNAT) domain